MQKLYKYYVLTKIACRLNKNKNRNKKLKCFRKYFSFNSNTLEMQKSLQIHFKYTDEVIRSNAKPIRMSSAVQYFHNHDQTEYNHNYCRSDYLYRPLQRLFT